MHKPTEKAKRCLSRLFVVPKHNQRKDLIGLSRDERIAKLNEETAERYAERQMRQINYLENCKRRY